MYYICVYACVINHLDRAVIYTEMYIYVLNHLDIAICVYIHVCV